MQRISHREYMAKLKWIEDQENNPRGALGVLVAYLMQIAAEIRRVLAKRPRSIKLEHFKIAFIRHKPKAPQTIDEQAKESKSRWRSALNAAAARTRLSGKNPLKRRPNRRQAG